MVIEDILLSVSERRKSGRTKGWVALLQSGGRKKRRHFSHFLFQSVRLRACRLIQLASADDVPDRMWMEFRQRSGENRSRRRTTTLEPHARVVLLGAFQPFSAGLPSILHTKLHQMLREIVAASSVSALFLLPRASSPAARRPRAQSAAVMLAVRQITTWHDPESQSSGSVPPVPCSERAGPPAAVAPARSVGL